MNNFRVELYAIEILFHILCSCYRADFSMCSDLEAGSGLCDINCVAHPADCLGQNAFEELCFRIDINVGVAVFSDGCGLNFTAKQVIHELCAVADTEYRDAELKELG